MFVTNWISTTKIQKISEITNFFRHYFLSRTEVSILNILAVAIQLNDHAKKAESPMLQYQAHELDYKSPHNSKFIVVSI